MPVYKDEQRGTWYVKFYYIDWMGNRKQKKKRGFKTQREAKAFEREFLMQGASDPHMTFASLLELYYKDMETRLRPGTVEMKKNIINLHIAPYFEKREIAEITNTDIRYWQNEMLKKTNKKTNKPYAQTYLRSLNSQLTAIFNYAVQYHNLPINPCQRVKSIGKKQAGEMQFWTLDEFNKAMEYETRPVYHICFMILFWCGLRVGECLALTPEKILHDSKSLDIYETYHRIKGEDVFGPPKTDNSIRRTPMPQFVYDELINYIKSIYGIGDKDRIFYFAKTALNKELDYIAKAAGVKRIRVHDLRHSHVSLLVELGYRTHAIADRIGDTAEVVDRTYAHLYPSTSEAIARELDKHRDGIVKDIDKMIVPQE